MLKWSHMHEKCEVCKSCKLIQPCSPNFCVNNNGGLILVVWSERILKSDHFEKSYKILPLLRTVLLVHNLKLWVFAAL